jgi:hypothetical protein
MEEIMGAVKSFLIGEGLLVGESSMSGARAFRRGGNVGHIFLNTTFIFLIDHLS